MKRTHRLVDLFVALSFIISPTLACMGGTPTPTPSATTPAPAQDCFGSGVTSNEWNPKQFNNEGGGPVGGSVETNCNFDSDCCWANENAPIATLQWANSKGTPDSAAFQKCFSTTTTPTGGFLSVETPVTPGSGSEAVFYSCTLACTLGGITVSLKHWATSGVKLQICQRDSFNDDQTFTNCQTLPATNGGPDTISLPQCNFCDLVIVGSGFTAGSAAAIDEMVTTYNICPNPTSSTVPPTTAKQPATPAPGPTPAPVCKAACNFEQGNTCSYFPLNAVKQGGGNQNWAVKQGPFGNPDTGVPHAAVGTHYLGVRLAAKNDRAVLQAGPLTLNKASKLKFKAYEATKNCQVKVCVNTPTNCIWTSNPGVDQSDRQWKSGDVPLDQSTKNVYIVAVNNGDGICYVGFDEFQVVGGGVACVPTAG